MEITPFPQSFSLLLYSKMVKKKKKASKFGLLLWLTFMGLSKKKILFLKMQS